MGAKNINKIIILSFALTFMLLCGITLNAAISHAAKDTKDSSRTDKLSDPPTTSSWLSDLEPIKAENGWGPVELDSSNGESGEGDGNILTLNGVTYDKGLGVHAPSKVSYYLGGNASRFISDIGVDDEISANGSQTYGTVEFQVLADGEKVYE
ncbi:NPCBM/NEW2 domain-containing protein [Virgibacillus dakarensis]|uniref:NPCBM/NEW2 domain-containing protein n=1 Tax=Virgibacillus dakarensis TaxID=1917889 RepID=UPI00190E7224|nr:NPCBM/NEW2 domain-containing protein [Virgibacillus dakarensis]